MMAARVFPTIVEEFEDRERGVVEILNSWNEETRDPDDLVDQQSNADHSQLALDPQALDDHPEFAGHQQNNTCRTSSVVV